MSTAKRLPFESGLYLDVESADYHADIWGPTLSRSIAHRILTNSERHAREIHPRLGDGAPFAEEGTDDRNHGDLIHGLILGRGTEVVRVEADDWRTKAARDARDEALADGRLPMLGRQVDAALSAAKGVTLALREAGVVVEEHIREAVALWLEPSPFNRSAGIACRARLDLLLRAEGVIRDLKIVRDAAPYRSRAWQQLARYGADLQDPVYRSAVETLFPDLAGRTRMEFWVCERLPPYGVVRVDLGGVARELARRRWLRAVERWEASVLSGSWPNYPAAPVIAEAPPWAIEQDLMNSTAVEEAAWITEAL